MMSDLLTNKDKIRAIFVGIKGQAEKYSGDGLECNIKYPDSCVVDILPLKACQLYADFPEQWKFPDVDIKELSEDYNPKLLVQAKSKKGVTLIHANGKKEHFPAGTKFEIIKPPKEKKKAKEKGLSQEAEPVNDPAPPPEVEPVNDPEPEQVEEKPVSDFPKHIGGGFYELSDGKKIRGKKKAKNAQKEIDEVSDAD